VTVGLGQIPLGFDKGDSGRIVKVGSGCRRVKYEQRGPANESYQQDDSGGDPESVVVAAPLRLLKGSTFKVQCFNLLSGMLALSNNKSAAVTEK
jgi:hypothetical protein